MKIRPLAAKISWWMILSSNEFSFKNCLGAKALYKAMVEEGLVATYGNPTIIWAGNTGMMHFGDRTFHVSTILKISTYNIFWPRTIIFTFKDVTPI